MLQVQKVNKMFVGRKQMQIKTDLRHQVTKEVCEHAQFYVCMCIHACVC